MYIRHPRNTIIISKETGSHGRECYPGGILCRRDSAYELVLCTVDLQKSSGINIMKYTRGSSNNSVLRRVKALMYSYP
jgi:hypothetical protein